MHVYRRLLHAAPPPAETMAADSDIVVILAALLCALICVVGLALVARCAWQRRSRGPASPVLQKKGVKKKLLRSLPSISFRSGVTDPKFADCAICLAEFVEGDEIRVLPPCGHGFHQSCVDAWLTSHSSCPSCRQVLVAPPAQCENCGVASASTTNAPPVGAPAESASQQYGASGSKAREEGDGHRYLP